MENHKEESDKVIKGQDFVKPEEKNQKPSSHGEVANQNGSDFTDLEESRMDNPPKHREVNGSENEGDKDIKPAQD